MSLLLVSGCLVGYEGGHDVASNRTVILIPNGAGSATAITTALPDVAHYLNVQTSDGDSSTVISIFGSPLATNFQVDTYALPDSPSSIGTIDNVTVNVRSRKSAGASAQAVSPYIYVESVGYFPSPGQAITSSFVTYSNEWTEHPGFSRAWTWDDVSRLEAGVRHTSLNETGTILTTHVWVEVNYTVSDWDEAPANLFTFLSDADTALKEYLENTTITHSNVSTLITYLEATVGTYRVTPIEVPKLDESMNNFPLVYIWTTGLRAPYEETVTTNVNPQTRILVWAENNDPASSADTVQALCGAIASAIQQTDKTAGTGSDWAGFYSNYGEPNVESQEITFVTVGEDVGLCRGELTVDWGHYG